MIGVALRAVVAGRAGVVGPFAALMLGVALLAAAGLTIASAYGAPDRPPRWHTIPQIVVAGPDRAGIGVPGDSALPPGEPGFIPPEAADRLAALGPVVVDRAGYARLGDATEAHPWAAASLHPSVLTGKPLAADDDVVLTAPTPHRPGDMVSVATAEGPRGFTVTGVVRTSAPPALYVTDRTAARLSHGRILAVALMPGAAQAATDAKPGSGPEVEKRLADVRAALAGWPGLRVLDGDARRLAEPDPEAGLLVAATALLGTMAGIAVFVAAFVVSGTFAFGVNRRRREFALLRAAGATPRQVRRLVLGEALVLGVPAGLCGCVAGAVLAPLFAGWMAEVGLAPSGFTAHVIWWPLAAAFAVGLLTALTGARSAARRAGSVRPAEALRVAVAERRVMTWGRWSCGAGALAGTVPVVPLIRSPAGSAYVLVVALLLIVGLTALAPVLVPLLLRALTFTRSRATGREATEQDATGRWATGRRTRAAGFAGRGSIGVLVRASVLASPRRVASTAAPVLATVGLAGAALAGTATFSAAEAQGLRDHVTAPWVAVASGPAALPDTLAAQVRQVSGGTPGTRVNALPVKTTAAYDSTTRGGDMIRQRAAWFVEGPAAREALALPVSAGSLDGLTGTATVALARSMGHAVGAEAVLWLGDGAQVRLRVVAVFDDRVGLPAVLLPWPLAAAHSAVPLPDSVYLGGGTDTGAGVPGDNVPGDGTPRKSTPEDSVPESDLRRGQVIGGGGPGSEVENVVRRLGGVVVPTRDHLATLDAEFDRLNRIALLATIGMALLYLGISVAGTQAMGTAGRAAEFDALRLAGATRGQLLRVVGWEAVLVLAAGTLLGCVVTAATLTGLAIALGPVTVSVPVVVPWPPLLGVAGCCAVLALGSGLLPATRILRPGAC